MGIPKQLMKEQVKYTVYLVYTMIDLCGNIQGIALPVYNLNNLVCHTINTTCSK